MYFLSSPSLITFLLKIDCTPSPLISKWFTKNPLFRFYFKKDINRYRGKLIGVLAVKILSFINNKGKFINIGDLNCDRSYIILIPLP